MIWLQCYQLPINMIALRERLMVPNTPWSNNKSQKLIPLVIRILKAISGNQIIAVINALALRTENRRPIIQQLPAVTPYTNVIRKLGQYADTLNSIDKWTVTMTLICRV